MIESGLFNARIADLRGRSDRECVAAMLAIAEATAQPLLQRQAVAAGKILRLASAQPPH